MQLVGRVATIAGNVLQCSGGLRSLLANADLKQARLLDRIDEHVHTQGLSEMVGSPLRPRPTEPGPVPTEVDLRGVAAIVWATGYRPSYRWLDPVAFDARGRVAHDGGVARLPGLYLLGLPFLRRRRSNLLAGLGIDATDLVAHLRTHLDHVTRDRATSRVAQSRTS